MRAARARRPRRASIFFAAIVAGAAGVAHDRTTAQQTPPSAQQPLQPPAPQQPQPQRPPVFRAGANFVLVDAYPQRDGKIVEGLTAAEFEVFEDGRPQAIDRVEFVRIDAGPAEGERRDPNNLNEMRAQAEDPHNRVFVTFLDTLHTTVPGSHAIRRPLVDTLNRLVGPTDLFGVMTPNMRPQDLTLGRRLGVIEDQLARYWTWGERNSITPDLQDPAELSLESCFHQLQTPKGSIEEWLLPYEGTTKYFDEILIERRREDRVLTALENLIGYMGGLRDARTVVLVVTDGWLLFTPDQMLNDQPGRDRRAGLRPRVGEGGITDPGVSARAGRGRISITDASFAVCTTEASRLALLDNDKRFRDLIEFANRSNVSIYPVASAGLAVFDGRGVGDRNPLPLSRDANRLTTRVQTLRTVAENTDGIAVVDTNDLAGGLRRIVDDVSAYYLLGYYSTNTKFDGKLRRIQVKVKSPGVNVRARRGYLAPSDAVMAKAEAANAAAPRTDAAVDDALGVLGRVRPGADVFSYGVAGQEDVAVHVELASRLLTPGLEWTKGAEVIVDVTSTSGATVGTAKAQLEPNARGVLLRVPTNGVAGPWRVSARVTSGREALDDRIEISAVTTKLLGSPLMSRATPSPRSVLRPVADFQFRRTERVHVEWPVLGTLDQRLARLLDRRGQPLAVPVTLTEREADGRTMVVVDVLLSALSEGDYVIEVTAGRGPETERGLAAFRVVR